MLLWISQWVFLPESLSACDLWNSCCFGSVEEKMADFNFHWDFKLQFPGWRSPPPHPPDVFALFTLSNGAVAMMGFLKRRGPERAAVCAKWEGLTGWYFFSLAPVTQQKYYTRLVNLSRSRSCCFTVYCQMWEKWQNVLWISAVTHQL